MLPLIQKNLTAHKSSTKAFFMNLGFWFFVNTKAQIACLHDQNKSGFFGRSAFFQPIKTF